MSIRAIVARQSRSGIATWVAGAAPTQTIIATDLKIDRIDADNFQVREFRGVVRAIAKEPPAAPASGQQKDPDESKAKVLADFFPTEIVALYTAMSGYYIVTSEAQTSLRYDWGILVFCAVATFALQWASYAAIDADGTDRKSPDDHTQWISTILSTIAFLLWALALPGNRIAASVAPLIGLPQNAEWVSLVAAVLAIVIQFINKHTGDPKA